MWTSTAKFLILSDTFRGRRNEKVGEGRRWREKGGEREKDGEGGEGWRRGRRREKGVMVPNLSESF